MAGRLVLRKKRRTGKLRRYTTPGCPMVRNRASWCMRLCTPIKGFGTCGRIAPHSLKGRTQLAIASKKAQQES